jgi:hypothetical protein
VVLLEVFPLPFEILKVQEDIIIKDINFLKLMTNSLNSFLSVISVRKIVK